METTRELAKEYIIEVLGEGAWQYACYNFNMKDLMASSKDLSELALIIQDLIAAELRGT